MYEVHVRELCDKTYETCIVLKRLCGPVDYDRLMQCFDVDGTEVRLAFRNNDLLCTCTYDHINLDLFIIHVDLHSLLVMQHDLHHGFLSARS